MALFIENGAYRNTIYTKQFPTGSNLGVKELAVHKPNKQYLRRVMALGDFLATPLQKTPKSPPEGKLMYPCKVQSNSTQHIIRTVSAMWGVIKSKGPLGYELEPSMVEWQNWLLN